MTLKTMGRLCGLIVLLVCVCSVQSAAQTDGWVPATPTVVVPNQLSVFTCHSNSGVNARWGFADGGYRYFGYLRRDPDVNGFQFWLAKLNEFNGDFNQAEMVKAFISSAEYRSRF